MSLLSLPNELLLEIASFLYTESDINSLVRVNRRLCHLLDDYLYKFNVRYCNASALNWAATEGREETVPKIFAVRAAFGDLYPRVRQAVELALDFSQEGVACKIIEHSAVDVNTHDTSGIALLNYAAVNDKQEFARFLLIKGADINTTCEDGKTSLRHAILHGNEGMVRLLAEYGAPVNSLPTGPCKDCEMGKKKHRCHPPLHQAAEGYSPEVVRALLDKGADPNLVSSDGLRPIHVAALCGDPRSLEELIAVSDVNCRDDWYHRTALHLAVKARNEGGMRVLLKAEGIDVNAKDCHDRTPLFLAAQQGDTHVVALLLEAPGIEIFAKNRWRQTALSKSVVQSCPTVEKLLWDKVKELSKNKSKKRSRGRRRRNRHRPRPTTNTPQE